MDHRQQNKWYPQRCLYLPISKLHSILAVANLLAHNNKSQICYCGQISLQSAAVDCSFSDTFGVTFILLAMVEDHTNCIKWRLNNNSLVGVTARIFFVNVLPLRKTIHFCYCCFQVYYLIINNLTLYCLNSLFFETYL